MKKSIIILGIALIASFEACGQSTKNDTDYSGAKAVVTNFYSWYIHDIYKSTYGEYLLPPFKKVKNQTYVFDEKDLSNKLNKISYLSSKYKNQLMDNLRLCNQELSKMKWESKPEPQFNSKNCGYLWGDNWVGGQGEEVDGFQITGHINTQGVIKISVEINSGKSVFTKTLVTVVRENNSFLIDDVVLVWE